MLRLSLLVLALILSEEAIAGAEKASVPDNQTAEVSRAELKDRIYGGWVGMLIGGIEGLPHEFKYIDKPSATLPEFKYLPNGAVTDDDNDLEWMHLYYMDKEGALKLPYPRIVEIWKANMNTGIWMANLAARKLMDAGFVPPETGNPARNDAASYNLSGQFAVESYGLIAPGMPQAAADIGLHYARTAVSGEPLQATRYWTTLISLNAFRKGTMEELMVEALQAVDPASAQAEFVKDAIKAWHDNPADWKASRQAMRAKWNLEKDYYHNSTALNGVMVALALLYGKDDFYPSLQYAMALGYDADCNAATVGAILGVRMGFENIRRLPGFAMPDRYRNETRPELPKEVKVSEQAEMMMRVCAKVILENGGQKIELDGQPGFRIRLQEPRLIEKP